MEAAVLSETLIPKATLRHVPQDKVQPFFVRVPPDKISPKLRTPKVAGV
jgi:hypothetical protein